MTGMWVEVAWFLQSVHLPPLPDQGDELCGASLVLLTDATCWEEDQSM